MVLPRSKSFHGYDKKAGNGMEWPVTAISSFANYVAGVLVAPDSGEARMTRVLERHPRLKFVSAENDISWLPHFC